MGHPQNRENLPERIATLARVSEQSMSLARRRPAIIVLAAIVGGILMGQWEPVGYWQWLLGAVVFFLAAGLALFKGRNALAGGLTLLAMCLLFAFRTGYQNRALPVGHIRHSLNDGQTYQFFGEIVDWPDVRERSTRLTVRLDSTKINNKTSSRIGVLLLHINTPTFEFQYGDRVIFNGAIREPPSLRNPGGFDYARFLRWKDISGIVYLPHHHALLRDSQSGFSVSGIVGGLRSFILGAFARVLLPEQAALASGFLIGETSGVSERVYGHFRRSGTLHLLAVSGSNVAIALLALRLFLWPFPLGRKSKYLALMAGSLVFCYISHTDPSVVRATVMIILFLFGRMMQFRIDYHNLIATAGALILIWNPNQLFSVGFQLSFVVAWALILFITAVREIFAGRCNTFWFKFGLLPLVIALSAQISATPIVLFYFGFAPLWSTAANLVIAPLVSFAVLMSLFVLLAELVFPPLGFMMGSVLNVVLSLVLEGLEFFGDANAPQIVLPYLSAPIIWSVVALVFMGGAALTSFRARRLLVWSLCVSPILLAVSPALGGARPGNGLWVFSMRSGICALALTGQPTLFLADLPGDAQSQFDYLIGPQLIRNGATENLNIIHLSGDFTTAAAAFIVADSFMVTRHLVSDRAHALVTDELTMRNNAGKSMLVDNEIEYCSGLDSLAIAHVLDPDYGSGESETIREESYLAVGRSMALFRSEALLALMVSASPDESEFAYVLRAIGTEQGAGLPCFIVLSEMNSRVVRILEKFSETANWRILAPRRSNLSGLSGELLARTQFLSETGAVFIKFEY